MELVFVIAIRVLVAAYIGIGAWMTVRVLARTGLRWWWAVLLWAPLACWVIPGAEIAGLLVTPLPVILTWAFAYTEWPALIDVGRIGRRSQVAPEPEPERLSERARSHTFFVGMEDPEDGDQDATADGAAAQPAAPPPAIDRTAPHVRRVTDSGAKDETDRGAPRADPSDAPVLRDADVDQARGAGVAPGPARPATVAGPDGAHGPADEPPAAASPSVSPGLSWMLSGFDDQGRVVRFQVRADDIRACDDGFILGRNPQVANMVVPDDSVSRRHARLRLRGERLMIEDLDSANGTWVDGRALNPHRAFELAHGASIELGGVKLTLTVA